MVDSGIWTRRLQLPCRGDTRHIYDTSHQRLRNIRAHKSWAVPGKGKNSDYRIGRFRFEFFSTENNKNVISTRFEVQFVLSITNI